MSREAPEIRLIRETLEGVLHPSTASTVFFEAISAGGGALPGNAEQALALARGPLKKNLADRLGDDEANTVVTHLEHMLGGSAPQVPRRASRNDEVTQNLHLSDEVLPVYVLAGSARLADQLRAVVGPQAMTPLVIGDPELLRTRVAQIKPGFVLIDGSDFPAIEPSELALTLAKLGGQIVIALWGADLPYGQSVLAEAYEAGCGFTPFDRREGIEPLIDVIRSRRSG
ncbi:MAG: hypothetical protein AB7S26_15740 [Sandaracinaceae bacterium]